MTTAALTPRPVREWTVFEAGDQRFVRDLELAQRAGLSRPRDVRQTITKLAEDGLAVIVDSPEKAREVAGAPGGSAVILAQKETVPRGAVKKDQEVTVYYLSEEAALHALMRLRTPTAVKVQREVVCVFLAVRGLLGAVPSAPPTTNEDHPLLPAGAAAPPPPSPPMPKARQAEILFYIGRNLSPETPPRVRDRIYLTAASLLTGERVALAPPAKGRWYSPTELGRIAKRTTVAVGKAITALELRGHPDHSQAVVVPRSGAEGTAEAFLYDGEAKDRILAWLEAHPTPAREEKPASSSSAEEAPPADATDPAMRH